MTMLNEWKDYYSDCDIPTNWVNVSYANDELPSFETDENQHKAYHLWVDSHDANIRRENTDRIYGDLYIGYNYECPRFCLSLCYGFNGADVFQTDRFEDVLQWIKDNPKTDEQIELTKEYV